MVDFSAEIPARHHGDLAHCRRLIQEAARVGCAAVQFRYFRVDQFLAPSTLQASAAHRLLRRQELPQYAVPRLADCARENGLRFGICPGDLDAVDLVLPHVDFLRVAASSLPWLDLIDRCADTGLPLVLGTAMADASEVWNAAQTALDAGCNDLTLLHGVARRPLPETDCNLAAVGTLREMLAREFAPLYQDAELKAGWSDTSVSAGVIARAVNHWGCDVVSFGLELPESAEAASPTDTAAAEACWSPAAIESVIAGGYLPVRRECDGTGRIAPSEAEKQPLLWRADPHDGLRPSLTLRRSGRDADPPALRSGPTVYCVVGGAGLERLKRSLALAERLRDDHQADVLFLIAGTLAQARCLARHGFKWARGDEPDEVAGQIGFLEHLAGVGTVAACILDLPEPVGDLVPRLQDNGLRTVVLGQPDCEVADLVVMPHFGWQAAAAGNRVGGSEYLLLRDDVVALRDLPTPGGSFPRILVAFAGADPDGLTTRVTAALHAALPDGAVQVVVDPEALRADLVAQILSARFPGYEILVSGDPVAPLLAQADLLLACPGPRLEEAVCLGVPAVVLSTDRRSAASAARWADGGAVVDLGGQDGVDDAELTQTLGEILADSDRMSQLRFHAREWAAGAVDGQGAARAARRIMVLLEDGPADWSGAED